MNEVEKMYENAGVEKQIISYCDWDSDCPYNEDVCKTDECPYWKTENSKYYPPFTAEKQLELIKWLIDKGQFRIERCLTKYYFEFRDYDLHTRKYLTQMTFSTLEEGIAFVINNIWQDLTEEERKQVKGILE